MSLGLNGSRDSGLQVTDEDRGLIAVVLEELQTAPYLVIRAEVLRRKPYLAKLEPKRLANTIKNMRQARRRRRLMSVRVTKAIRGLAEEVRSVPVDQRVEYALDYLGCSNDWLACEAKVPAHSVDKWRRGMMPRKIQHSIRVAHAFGMTADYFWSDSDEHATVPRRTQGTRQAMREMYRWDRSERRPLAHARSY